MRILAPRWRKVIRDVWRNKSRAFLVILSIAVGIFAVGVVSGSQSVFLREINQSYTATNPVSGRVFLADEFDNKVVETIESLPEVEAAEGKQSLSFLFKANSGGDWRSLTLTAVDDFETMKTEKVWPISGAWPPPKKQLLVERKTLAWMGVDIGDSITIKFPNSRKEKQIEVTGIVHDQSQLAPALTRQGSGYINLDTLEWLAATRKFYQLNFVVAQDKLDKQHIEHVGDQIKKKLENQADMLVLYIDIPTPGEHPYNRFLESMMLVLSGLGVLALLLSGFLVINTISALLAQHIRQIGIMKSIGATRPMIMQLYFVTVLIYGLVALVIAIPAGIGGAWLFTKFMANFFNIDIQSHLIPPTVYAVQIAIGLLVPVIAAIYPIISGTSVTVHEAISNNGSKQNQVSGGLIDRLLQRLRGISRPLMLSLRNTFRRKGRLVLTLVTLTIAGAIFISVFNVRDSLMVSLDRLLTYWQYDVDVQLVDNYRSEKIIRMLSQIPGVSKVESWGFYQARRLRPDDRHSKNYNIVAPYADTGMINPELRSGRWLEVDDTNALVVNTDLLKKEPDLKVGDEVVLKFGRRETRWQIVGVVQGLMAEPLMYANYPFASYAARQVGKATTIQVSTNTADATGQKRIAQQIEMTLDRAGIKVSETAVVDDFRQSMISGFNFLIQFLLSMAVILAVVGGLGLSGTMSLNVLERVREIGVMRAIGASDGSILQLVLIEGAIIGLLSWVAASALALPIGMFASKLIGLKLMEMPLKYTFSINGVLIWLVIAVIVAILASYWPARSASRLTVREVLTHE